MNNFWRYLLLAVVLFVASIVFVVVRNWDTVSIAWENATALQEGGEEAQQISTPEDLAAYLGRHPEKVSLAVIRGDGTIGDTAAARTERPLPRLPMVLLLAGAAEQMADGRLDPEARVPVGELERFALPGLTASAHEEMVDSLTAAGRVETGPSGTATLSVREVVMSLHTFQNRAAADWLIQRMGRQTVEALPERFGMAASAAPRPTAATYLTWMRHARGGDVVSEETDAAPDGTLPGPYLGMVRTAYLDSVYATADRLAEEAYRNAVTEALTERGTALSVKAQRAYAMATFPRGTALDYARLMAQVRTSNGEAWSWLRTLIETPLADAGVEAAADSVVQEALPLDTSSVDRSLESVADVAGAHPGILTLAGYGRMASADAEPPVVVLMMHDLPVAVFYQLAQTGIDKGLFLELLLDESAAERLTQSLRRP